MKQTIKPIHILSIFFLAVGCAGVPFDSVKMSSIEGASSEAILENFKKKLPEQFSIIESVEICYRGRKVAAIGYTELNERTSEIAVGGFSPVGVKLFSVQLKQNKLDHSFALPKTMKKMDPQKIAQSILEDVRNIYFDRLPLAQGNSLLKKDRLQISVKKENGFIQYTFGGSHQALIDKKYQEGKRKVWRVRYFDYQTKGGHLYPSKIFYEHFGRHYQVVLRLKEILV